MELISTISFKSREEFLAFTREYSQIVSKTGQLANVKYINSNANAGIIITGQFKDWLRTNRNLINKDYSYYVTQAMMRLLKL